MAVKGAKALEVWARRVTDGYPGVSITNMSSSWKDGLAFCAIVHRFRPDLISFRNLDPKDIERNCCLVFSVAEEELGIPSLLDPIDMAQCGSPDRLSILTYLSEFYHKFKAEKSPQGSPATAKKEEAVAVKPQATDLRRKDSCDSGVSVSPLGSVCNSPPSHRREEGRGGSLPPLPSTSILDLPPLPRLSASPPTQKAHDTGRQSREGSSLPKCPPTTSLSAPPCSLSSPAPALPTFPSYNSTPTPFLSKSFSLPTTIPSPALALLPSMPASLPPPSSPVTQPSLPTPATDAATGLGGGREEKAAPQDTDTRNSFSRDTSPGDTSHSDTPSRDTALTDSSCKDTVSKTPLTTTPSRASFLRDSTLGDFNEPSIARPSTDTAIKETVKKVASLTETAPKAPSSSTPLRALPCRPSWLPSPLSPLPPSPLLSSSHSSQRRSLLASMIGGQEEEVSPMATNRRNSMDSGSASMNSANASMNSGSLSMHSGSGKQEPRSLQPVSAVRSRVETGPARGFPQGQGMRRSVSESVFRNITPSGHSVLADTTFRDSRTINTPSPVSDWPTIYTTPRQTPLKDTTLEDTPSMGSLSRYSTPKETLTERKPSRETTSRETAIRETPIGGTPSREEPSLDFPPRNKPSVNTSSISTSSRETSLMNTPSSDTCSRDTPKRNTLARENQETNPPKLDTPSRDTPTRDTPTRDTPTRDTQTRDTLTRDTPTRNTPTRNTPSRDIPSRDTPTRDTPTRDTPTKDTPTKDTPTKDTPTKDTPTKDTPTKDTPTRNTPKWNTPTMDTPTRGTPTRDTLTRDTLTKDTPTRNTPSRDTPPRKTPTRDPPSADPVGGCVSVCKTSLLLPTEAASSKFVSKTQICLSPSSPAPPILYSPNNSVTCGVGAGAGAGARLGPKPWGRGKEGEGGRREEEGKVTVSRIVISSGEQSTFQSSMAKFERMTISTKVEGEKPLLKSSLSTPSLFLPSPPSSLPSPPSLSLSQKEAIKLSF